jgi:transposase-like protein
MSYKKRRIFTEEEKADAVRLVRVSGESIPTIARYLGIHESSIRYYAFEKRPVSKREKEDKALLEEIRAIHRHWRWPGVNETFLLD